MPYSQNLIDDFHSTTLNTTTLWTTPNGATGITAGGSTLTEASSTAYPAIKSIPRYDLTGGILAIQLSQSGTASANSQWFIECVDASGNGVGVEADPLNATWSADNDGSAVAGTPTKITTTFWTTPWVNGQWVGLGMTGSTMFFYKSVDTQTWTEIGHYTVSGTFNKNSVSLQLTTGLLTGTSTWATILDNASFFTLANIQPALGSNRRRPVKLPRGHGRIGSPVPTAQIVVTTNPPIQPARARVRGLRIFRGRAAGPVPAQIIVPPAYPPQSVRTRLRGLRIFRGRAAAPLADQGYPAQPSSPRRRLGFLRRRPAAVAPVPPQVVVPPVYPPAPVRVRVRGLRLFRGRQAAPAPDQNAVPAVGVRKINRWGLKARPRLSAPPIDQLIVGQQSTRRRFGFRRPGRIGQVVPPQATPAPPAYPPAPVRTRLRFLRIFRGRAAAPVPAQVSVLAPGIVLQAVRTRLRGLRIFRGRAAAPVPGQIVVAPPAYVPGGVRRVIRGLRIFRARAAGPVPGQIVVAQASYVPASVRRVVRALWPRRRQPAAPPIEQGAPPATSHGHAHPMMARRGRMAGPPVPQIVPPPAYPPAPVKARARGLFGRRGKASVHVSAQAAPPVGTHAQNARRRPWGIRLGRPKTAAPVPPQIVIIPPVFPPAMTRVKKRFGKLFRGSARWTPTAPLVVAPRTPTVTVDLARNAASVDLSRVTATSELGRSTTSVDLTRTILTVDLSRVSVTVTL